MFQNSQRTEEWYRDRLGHITGSRFADIITKDKSGKRFLAARETAMTEIALEILTGRPGAMWSSKATQWGNDHEPEARIAYEAHTGAFCSEVGFIRHPVHKQVGCSPDGLVDHDGGWEAKCPFTPTVHLQTLLYGMPPEHMAQVQGGMWCTGRKWWDFVSYHPGFPDGMQLYIQRIERDQAFIDDMEDKILDAICEINLNVKELLQRYGAKHMEAA